MNDSSHARSARPSSSAAPVVLGRRERAVPVPDPEALVQAAQQGDAEALRALHNLYAPLLKAAARWGRGRRHDEDAADWEQEAYLAFLELLQAYRRDGCSSFGTYLRRKLRWRMANKRRTERRDAARTVPLGRNAARLAGEDPLESGVLDRVWLAGLLPGLSLKQRQVLHLVYWEDRTTAEVATALGISCRAALLLQERAERALRELARMC